MEEKSKEMVLETVAVVAFCFVIGVGLIQQTYLCFNPHKDSDIYHEETHEAENVESTPLLAIQ